MPGRWRPAPTSRDAIEDHPDLQARTSEGFQEGRRWGDVIAGRFRRDQTTGLRRLLPVMSCGHADEGQSKSTRVPDDSALRVAAPWVQPVADHGFAVLGMERVWVEVKETDNSGSEEGQEGGGEERQSQRGATARLVGVEPHPTFASLAGRLAKNRWSGNDFLAKTYDLRRMERVGGGSSSAPTAAAATSTGYGSIAAAAAAAATSARSGSAAAAHASHATPPDAVYTRLRVRFTCDEDAVPWCKER